MANIAGAALGLAVSTAKAKMAGQVVTQTLDKLNSGAGSKRGASAGMSDTYHFAKDVLSSVYSGKGAIASLKG